MLESLANFEPNSPWFIKHVFSVGMVLDSSQKQPTKRKKQLHQLLFLQEADQKSINDQDFKIWTYELHPNIFVLVRLCGFFPLGFV